MQSWPLKQFFHEFGARKDSFQETFAGAFLMVRFRDSPPEICYLPADEGFELTVGSDEDADLDFVADPTLEEQHCVIAFHTGFRGWTVEDKGTSFGTTVQGERIEAARPILLTDRDVIKAGGGLLQLQFYTSASLLARMNQAGVTRTMSRLQKRKLGGQPGGAGGASPGS